MKIFKFLASKEMIFSMMPIFLLLFFWIYLQVEHVQEISYMKALIHDLSDKNKYQEALKLLAQIENEDMIPYLLDKLSEKNIFAQKNILNFMLHRNFRLHKTPRKPIPSKYLKKAVNTLIEVIRNNKDMSNDVSLLLAQEGTFPILIDFLDDKDDNIKIFVLERINESRIDIVNSGEVTKEVATNTKNKLMKLLKHKNPMVKAKTAYTIGCIKYTEKEAVESLIALLKDESDIVKRSAANGLGEMEQEASSAIPYLIECLGSSCKELRGCSVLALGEIRSQHSLVIPHILKTLNDNDAWVRASAIRGFQAMRLNDKFIISAVIKKLSDEDVNVILAAIRCLGVIGKESDEAISEIRNLSNSKNERIKTVADIAIESIEREKKSK